LEPELEGGPERRLSRIRVFQASMELIYDKYQDASHPAASPWSLRTRAKTLTPSAKLSTQRLITGTLAARKSVELKEVGFFTEPRIEGLRNGGAPGHPSLPVEVRYVLLPSGAVVQLGNGICMAKLFRTDINYSGDLYDDGIPGVSNTPDRT
jgi:hypothetical protein